MAKETALQEARRRFNEVSQRVLTDGDNWEKFLTCAARNHKYEFRDQLLIYDQRPNATACADIELWNKHFNRWVNRGTKSVRLLSPDGRSVRHVFDITDTRSGFGHEFDEPPYVWKIEPEDSQDVSARLNQAYGVSGELGVQIAGISREFALNLEKRGDPLYASASSEAERRKLTDLLTNSVEYYLRTRCGLENRREDFSFESISELDGRTAMRLGSITNVFSRHVLDNVERVVRTNHDRRRLENERSESAGDSLSDKLHDERGIESGGRASVRGIGDEAGGGPDDISRVGTDGIGQGGLAGGESDEGRERRSDIRESSGHLDSVPTGETETAATAVDEIRENEAEISGRVESTDGVRVGRESSDTLFGDTGAGESDEARTDDAVRTERPAARQKPRPNGLGTTHERTGHAGRGNSNEKPDLPLSLFDDLEEQENIGEIENISSVPTIENTVKDIEKHYQIEKI